MSEMQEHQESNDFYDFKELENIRNSENSVSGWGQEIRKKSLTETRTLLYLIGFITIATNVYSFIMSSNEVARRPIPPEKVEMVVTLIRLICGAGISIGMFFIVAGFYLMRYPVRLASLCLAVHVGYLAILGFLNPMTIMDGILLKLFVLISLISAIKLASDYQKHEHRRNTDKESSDHFKD